MRRLMLVPFAAIMKPVRPTINIKLFDNLLLIIGLKLFIKSRFQNILNYVIRVILFPNFIIVTLIQWRVTYNNRHDKGFVLNNLATALGLTFMVIGYIKFLRNRRKLHQLIIYLGSQPIEVASSFTYKLNSGIVVILTTWMLLNVLFVYSLPPDDLVYYELGIPSVHWSKVTEYGVVLYLVCHYVLLCPMQMTIQATLYVYFVHLLTLAERELLSKARSINFINGKQLTQEMLELQSIKDTFNECFEFYPFVWLLHLFLNSSGQFVYILTAIDDTFYFLYLFEYGTFLTYVVTLFGCLMIANNYVTDVRAAKQRLILDLITPDNYSTPAELFINVLDRTNFELSVAGMFKVDRRLLLTFAEATVTFSVLFAGLVGVSSTA